MNLIAEPDHGNKILRVSHSSMSTFRGCTRRFEFRKMYGTGYDESGLAANVGSALHEAYQAYIVAKLYKLPNAVQTAMWTLIQHYPFHQNTDPSNFRSIEACYATLYELIGSDAVVEYSLAQIECLDGVTRPAIEVPFEITIKGIEIEGYTIIYTGYTDAILFDKLRNVFTVIDLKTHRDNMIDQTAKFMFSDQLVPYAIVLEQMLGMEINTLEVKYLSAKVDIQNPRVTVYPFNKSKADVEDWARTLYVDLTNMKHYIESNWWPRNGNNCMSWNRPCGFMDICHSHDPKLINKWVNMGRDPDAKVRVEKEPWAKFDLELG